MDQPLYDIMVEGEEEVAPDKVQEVVKSKDLSQIAPVIPTKRGDKVLATPAVRQLAKQLDVNLEDVTPTGKQSEVTASDVKRRVLGTSVPEEDVLPFWRFDDDEIEPLVGVKNLMAETMRQSNRMIPHFTFFDEVDVEALSAFKKEYEIKVTYMPFYIRALSLALQQLPYANASLDINNKQIILHKRHNIGLAMNTPQGLLVPVLKDVQSMSFKELVKNFEDLKKRALEGALTPNDMKEGTISLTNFGTLGGIGGTPVIPYPQTAIAGLGRIEKKAVVVEDQIEVRRRQMVCWSFDHRLIDGAGAATLSSTFIKLLEDPDQLV